MSMFRMFAWNTGEEPVSIPAPDDFDVMSRMVGTVIQTKEYAKIVRSPLDFSSQQSELVLYYRAFDDPWRGRQYVSGIDLDDLNEGYARRMEECKKRCFAPSELYGMKPISVSYDSYHVLTVHLSAELSSYHNVSEDKLLESKRFETRTLVDHSYDGRRTWTLQTVWFDNQPVMVVNSSGRDGDEYDNRWITDGANFHNMVSYLNSLIERDEDSDFVKADAVIPAMTEFYNGTIHDFYDVVTQTPRNK